WASSMASLQAGGCLLSSRSGLARRPPVRRKGPAPLVHMIHRPFSHAFPRTLGETGRDAMSNATPRKRLPDNPSIEHLRKQAKRLARRESIALSEAQRRLAGEY